MLQSNENATFKIAKKLNRDFKTNQKILKTLYYENKSKTGFNHVAKRDLKKN